MNTTRMTLGEKILLKTIVDDLEARAALANGAEKAKLERALAWYGAR